MPETSYENEMTLGREALDRRDYQRATRHFGLAHALGHDVSCRHIEAHKGMLRVGWRTRSLRTICGQLFLLVAAALFDRPRPPANKR